MIHPSLEIQLPEIKSLLKKHKVKNAYLFGSSVTEGFNKDSDVDFLVNFQDDLDPLEKGGLFWDLMDALKHSLNREVDVLSEKALKNKYFIEELNETKVKIYG